MTTVTGDLVTYVRVRGARRLIGPSEFSGMAEKLADQMRIKLTDGTGNQHALSVGYLSDPPGTPFVIKELLKGSIATAHRMGAVENAKIWFDERAKFLSALCNDETFGHIKGGPGSTRVCSPEVLECLLVWHIKDFGIIGMLYHCLAQRD